jgi:hypothetical protein
MLRKLEKLSNDLNKDGFLKEAGVVDDILNTLSKALKGSEDGKEDEDKDDEKSEEEASDGSDDEQVEFHGESTENFDLCPGAVKAFNSLKEKVDDDSKDLAVEALRETDELLGVEKTVLEADAATLDEFKKVVELAQNISYKAGVLSEALDEDLTGEFEFLKMHVEKVSDLVK